MTRLPTRVLNGASIACTLMGIGAEPSVEPPIPRRGRTVSGVSYVWHAFRACHGHPHERARHTGVAPFICSVILGLCINVLWPRRIVLEGWDRPNAVSVRAEAVDHGPAILAD